MSSIFPRSEFVPDYWQQCDQLLPHALECIALDEQWNGDPEQQTTLINAVATSLANRTRYAEAEALYRQALHLSKNRLPPEHPLVANTLSDLGYFYFEQGNYPEAESLLQRALSLREQILDAEDPLLASSLNRLANLYQRQGKYPAARDLLM